MTLALLDPYMKDLDASCEGRSLLCSLHILELGFVQPSELIRIVLIVVAGSTSGYSNDKSRCQKSVVFFFRDCPRPCDVTLSLWCW